MKTYAQLLKDPRWQKKRLQVLERDEFTCQSCFDSESSLHVHHCYYKTGNMPWEYEDSSLVTLCEECHSSEKDALQYKISLSDELSKYGFLGNHFETLAWGIETGYQRGHLSRYAPDVTAYIIAETLAIPSLYDSMVENHSKIQRG